MDFEINSNKLEQVIFKYLDNKLTIKETPDGIFFSENDGDDELVAQIKVGEDKICRIRIELLDDVESFFSIEYPYSADIISEYVEKTLGIELFKTTPVLTKWKF